MQDNLKHDRNCNCRDRGTDCSDAAKAPRIEPLFSQMSKYSACAEPKQRDRDRQESKVVEQDNREKPREGELQQQRREAAQCNSGQQSSARDLRFRG